MTIADAMIHEILVKHPSHPLEMQWMISRKHDICIPTYIIFDIAKKMKDVSIVDVGYEVDRFVYKGVMSGYRKASHSNPTKARIRKHSAMDSRS